MKGLPTRSRITSTAVSEEILRALDQLEAESNERRAELRRIAAELPATMSRRALVRSVVADARRSEHKGAIVRRALAKVARAPLHALKRLQLRLRAQG